MTPDFLLDDLRQAVAVLVELEPDEIGDDDNLFEVGLDSISLMQFVSDHRRRGTEVSFADLAEEPTLNAWCGLFGAAGPATADPASQPAGDVERHEHDPAGRNGASAGEHPLALMQRAYWVGRGSGQPLGGVAAHLYTELDRCDDSPLDPGRLARAFDQLVERHDTLRLSVTEDGYQQVSDTARWKGLTIDDLRSCSDDEVDSRLGQRREQWSHQMLDIDGGEVLAAALSLLPGDRTRLHLDVDMIAADAVSYRLLLGELARLYADPDSALPALPASYLDCSVARTRHQEEAAGPAAAWWNERLPSLPLGPQLPLAAEPPARARATRRHFHLDARSRDALFASARQRKLTPAAVLATAFAEVVGGWSVAEPFLLNVPLFHRTAGQLDASGVVGDFSSSVMVAVDVTEPVPFAERAAGFQTQLHSATAHADHSGLDVLRDLGRLRGRQVVAPVVFTSALGLGELFEPEVRRQLGHPAWIISQGPQVLLDAQVTELDGGLLVNWDCRSEQLVDGVLDEMFVAFERLVGDLAAGERWTDPVETALPATRKRATAHLDDGDATRTAPAVAPRTALERAVAHVWCDVLGTATADLGVDDELFSVGGDSVLAATIVTHLRDIFETSAVTIRSLFAAPTVAGLAATMAAAEAGSDRLEQVAELYWEIVNLSDDEVAAQLAGDEALR